MAVDKLINETQGNDIIDKLEEIAENVSDISFGLETSSDKIISMSGYQRSTSSTPGAISQGDTLNEAIGKLEKKADDNASAVADKIDKLTSATAGDIATVTATGEIADSTVAIETTLSDSSDAKVPTSKAVGTYVAGKGYAVGVSSSTTDHIVTFNGTDGKTLKDSGVTVATTADTTKDTEVPTSKAVNTLISNKGYAVGANSSTANHIVTFNGTDGKALKDSGYTVNTTLTNVATDIPTGSAVSTALAGKVAGPGSSTSNDIMLFSDATGKVASDSGVQIEKNTSFSDTSDAKIPTSKSIAQNVAGKAVLKNYSVATAQETISASTTIKDAVEQLDYRTTTNQNSILSIEQHNGFKNYINTTSPYYLYQSQSDGLTYTMQSDGTMTISGSKTSSSWADIYIGYVNANITYQAPPVIPANDYVIICDGIPNNANITLWGKIGGAAETQLGTAATGASPRSTFTVSADTIITKWKISITSSTAVNFVFKPLLVDQVTADMGFTEYKPYALSNVTVTPGLIEVVDSGAKNVLQNVATSKTENNVTFTVNTDGSVKVQTTAAGASAGTNLSLTGSYISNKYGGYVISGIPAGTLDSVYLYVAYSNNGTSESTHKEVRNGNTLIIDGSYSHIQVIVRVQSGAIATTALTLYPMVCTKAAFGVSQKFVPYRPNWDLVGGLATALTSTTFNTVSVANNMVSNIEGGYIRIGNLVIVNIRCVVNTDIPATWTIIMSGLPKPIVRNNETKAGVACSNNKFADIAINGVGSIACSSAVASGENLIISGTYFTK